MHLSACTTIATVYSTHKCCATNKQYYARQSDTAIMPTGIYRTSKMNNGIEKKEKNAAVKACPGSERYLCVRASYE